MPFLSLVIPLFNEQDNVKPLYERIVKSLKDTDFEVILVDDGSIDNTANEVCAITDKRFTLIKFNRNFGQTAALAAGIEYAKGEYIATLDGDLQNDPKDIPKMLKIIQEKKLDLIAGVRKKRKDGMIMRKIPSKVANWLIRRLTKVNISDYGCTLKVYKAKLAKNLELHGELHRFIPVLSSLYGAKIGEVEVNHYPRIHGESKYGINRTFKVASDLLLMYFFQKYRQKPMHLFGNIGFMMLSLGMLIEAYLLLLKIFGESIGGRPLFYVGILLIITSVQFITTGFIAELLMRIYYGAQNKKPYVIEKIVEL